MNVGEWDFRRTFKLDGDIDKNAIERIVLDLYVLCSWAGVTTRLLGWTPRAARKEEDAENEWNGRINSGDDFLVEWVEVNFVFAHSTSLSSELVFSLSV